MTVTCLKSDSDSLMKKLKAQELTVKAISLEGRFHCSALATSANRISELCASNEELQFPRANRLQVPLRSNSDAQVISDGSLHDAALQSIMTKVANWHLTISSASYQSGPTGRPSSLVVSIGPVDSFPQSIARDLGLRVTRIRNFNLLSDDLGRPEFMELPAVKRETGPDLSFKDSTYPDHAVAVIGMACKFPGADSVDEFWHLLNSGASMHQEVPAERFPTHAHRRSPGKTFFGNFVRDADAFDHRFFKKSSREAASTDPQQRLLLQVAYEALASSGYFSGALDVGDDVGCYVGVCASDYNDNVAGHNPNAFSSLGTLRAFLTGKISHFFGWTGPSVTYDTACSSSAVAIHAACKALQLGECSRAVAGGVSLFTSPYFYQNLAAASFLSLTGPTKSFDAGADGYCRGEGLGLVVLKKLASAVADRDNVLGVISATAVSQCSNTVPITVPHSPSQIKLFHKLLALANLKPTDISYVEAHGTGTSVGDPLELESIRSTFGGSYRPHVLHVGSVKANIGHTEGASGVAALIKTILMMQHKIIPRQTNFSRLNPKIPALEPYQMAIPRSSQEWNSDTMVACINNYGAAGSIAAMILCQPPKTVSDVDHQTSALPKYPIFLSAKSPTSLRAYCTALRDLLQHLSSTSPPGNLLANLSFNLAEKQNRSFPHLLTTTVSTLAELNDQLHIDASTSKASLCDAAKPKPVVLAFAGQTNSFVGLSEEVYHGSALLRSHLDHCDVIIRSLGQKGLYPGIFSTEPQEDIASLHAMQFALQYSCAMAWIASGLRVDKLVGHSFGQLTALTISNSLSLVDGLKLVCGRALLMQEHWGSERGSMVAVEADFDTVSELMSSVQARGHRIETACYNSLKSHVLVGAESAIQAVEQTLADSAAPIHGTKYKKLNVTHGFHSELTEPVLPHLYKLAEGLTFKEATIPLETCSDAQSWAVPEPKLIAEHTRTPVYFRQAVERITHQLGPCAWLEAGSNSSITGMARRALGTENNVQHTFHPINLSGSTAMSFLADATVDLWKNGHRVQFWPFHRSQKCDYKQLDLPPYQFEKSRHWLEWVDGVQQSSPAVAPNKKEKGEPILLSFVKFRDQNQLEAEFCVDPKSEQYRLFVQGHRVLANPLCPAPLYVELVVQAALTFDSTLKADTIVPCVEKLEIKAPLGYNQDRDIKLLLKKIEGGVATWQFELYSQSQTNGSEDTDNIQQHTTGIVILWPKGDLDLLSGLERFQRLVGQDRCEDLLADHEAEAMQGSLIYKVFSKVVHYSEYYKGVKSISSKGREVAGRVILPPHGLDALHHTVSNPLAIDNFIQVAGLHVNSLNTCGDNEVFICTKIDRIQFSSQFGPSTTGEDRAWSVFSYFSSKSDKELTNDIFVFDSAGRNLVFLVFGARFTKVLMSSLTKVLSRSNTAQNQQKDTLPMGFVAGHAPQDSAVHLGVDSVHETISPDLSRKRIQDPSAIPCQKDNRLSMENELRDLLSKITDVPVAAFRDESTMEDLGIDSLMITEITTEIRQVFGIDIPQADLQDLPDFETLKEYLRSKRGDNHTDGAVSSRDPGDPSELLSSHSPAVSKEIPPSNASMSKKDHTIRLAQVVAGHLETSPTNLFRHTNLADLGLDSLLCMELASDIKDSFAVTINITQLTNESTFGELSDMVLQASPLSLTTSLTEDGMSAATTTAGTPISAESDNTPVPGTLTTATTQPASLVSAQRAFEKVRYNYDILTKETGFFDFWKLVYPSQARLVLAYVVEAFSRLGCSLASLQPGERVPKITALPKHERLVTVLYEILRDASLIEFTGVHFVRSEVLIDTTSASELYHGLLCSYPKHAAEHELLNVTGSNLAQLLIGAADPLQLLFGSKKNKELLEEVYTNGPMYEAITKLLGTFLGAALSADNDGRKFHILELGGGTGSTTKHILDILVQLGISFSYTFTDISSQLVAAGRRKFAKYDFVDFMVLDIEKTPPMKFNEHFHIILSTNCIHATRNLESSLSHIHQMLREDGFVSLVEFTRNMFWFDLVFGFLEGWWLFEDGRQHVLADEAFWEKSMKASGYKHVAMTDGTSLEARTLRIITGFPARPESRTYQTSAIPSQSKPPMETLAYKTADENVLCADIYYPGASETSKSKRPVGTTASQ